MEAFLEIPHGFTFSIIINFSVAFAAREKNYSECWLHLDVLVDDLRHNNVFP